MTRVWLSPPSTPGSKRLNDVETSRFGFLGVWDAAFLGRLKSASRGCISLVDGAEVG